MKRILYPLFLILFCTATTAVAQKAPKLSPLTRKYLLERRASVERETNTRLYVYKVGPGNRVYISGMVKVGNGVREEEFRALGVRVGTKAGPIWTVQIPVENVEEFTRLSGIEYIQIDEPLVPALDSVRRTTRVDSVHAGYNLPTPYSGAGVVVGVVDAGFDYGHPTLLDTTGSTYRVRRVWEQKNSAGSPPEGYLYGTEMTDSATIRTKATDSNGSHGIHVAGICGGSGFGSAGNSRYRGIAYDADLVFVSITPDKSQWVNTGASDIIDGVNYVFRYADSVGKPAVVNLSWGTPLGSRDGNSLVSQALDNLVDTGRIFVCSAGNNGDNRGHLQKQFSPTDTIVRTFLTVPESPAGRKTWVDIWGEPGMPFCAEISLYHDSSEISTTGRICLDDSTHNAALVGSNGDTCFVGVMTSTAEFNGKPRIFLDFDTHVPDSIIITLQGNTGTLDMWTVFVHRTSGYYGAFNRFGLPWATSGNSDISISDIATTRSAITVGAYASKVGWTSTAGFSYSYSSYVGYGRLVPFSSHGPTADGRVKPDITGPGLTVGSSVSSYDADFASGGPDTTFITATYHNPTDGKNYSYAVLSGTSMSGPSVSGIVALMLQVNPRLTPQQVKDVLAQTAIRDNFTGVLPPGGNNLWGNGKVNGYGAVARVVQLSASVENIAVSSAGSAISPNPNTGAFTLHYKSSEAEEVRVEIRTVVGQPVRSDTWRVRAGENLRQYDLAAMSSGIYFVEVSGRQGRATVKMVVE